MYYDIIISVKKQEFYDHKNPRKLMDRVSDVMRLKHYAFRTEQTYAGRIKRFILVLGLECGPGCKDSLLSE